MNGEKGLKCGLVQSIRNQLKEMRSWFHLQRHFRFHDSSILLSYDAKKFTECDESKNDREDSEPTVPATVRMIDFGRTIKNMKDEVDENYLFGLNSLLFVLENLKMMYADTLLVPRKRTD